MPLDSPTCFKQLQHLEQEGAVQPDLSSFGKKICIYNHTEQGGIFRKYARAHFNGGGGHTGSLDIVDRQHLDKNE
jgi:hypothetical protein